MALEWHETKVSRWSEGYASDIIEAFNKDIFPYIDVIEMIAMALSQIIKQNNLIFSCFSIQWIIYEALRTGSGRFKKETFEVELCWF